MTGIAAALDARDRQDAARAHARSLPPLTDAQVARVAALLTLGRTPEPKR
ncbi:hypothetical protein [Curtobacterium sp. VKM Ac-1395]|nr:hypothetical protein [Curtobacterium sp. VKM Ac-1395]MBF4591262.1 hypothetical protein [Curtobacterium sp. VKM Ac-1395]